MRLPTGNLHPDRLKTQSQIRVKPKNQLTSPLPSKNLGGEGFFLRAPLAPSFRGRNAKTAKIETEAASGSRSLEVQGNIVLG